MYLYVTRKVPVNNVFFNCKCNTAETEFLFQLLINTISNIKTRKIKNKLLFCLFQIRF